jgi:hypothetical protein
VINLAQNVICGNHFTVQDLFICVAQIETQQAAKPPVQLHNRSNDIAHYGRHSLTVLPPLWSSSSKPRPSPLHLSSMLDAQHSA